MARDEPGARKIVEELFQRAVDLAPGERDVFLHQNCDSSLMEKVVELLELHDRADSLVADSPEKFEPVLTEAVLDFDQIAGYRILRRLGQGGMGIVFEATQENPRRKVAVKIMHPSVVSSQVRRRFQLEGEILGQLHHPGIAEVYEAGIAQTELGELPFIAMQLVEGEPLLEYAQGRNLGKKTRLELMEMVCSAVDHAHSRGVIHRDLKPSNILVDGGGHPKILDFGIARSTDSDLRATTIHTQMGQLVGTLPYMSPEQVRADPCAVDTRSDVYALGVILFELLVGRLPHDLSELSIPEAVRVVDLKDPPLLGSFDRTLRGDVETIVQKAMEKDPGHRYDSAASLAAEIRRYLCNEPIVAQPPSAVYRVRKFALRNRVLVAGVLATFLVLVIGVVVAVTLAMESDRHAQEAERQAERARRATYRARIGAASAIVVDRPDIAARHLEAAPPELRGWEWRHIHSQLARHVIAYPGPAKPGDYVSFDASGEYLVGLLGDDTVGVWRALDGTFLRALSFGAPLRTLALPSGGPARLALATTDGRVILCDLDGAGRVERHIEADDVDVDVDAVEVARVAWDRQGRRLAIATVQSQHVLIWDGVREPHLLLPAAHHRSGQIWGLAFAPDGLHVALAYSGNAFGAVRRWDVTGRESREFVLPQSIRSFAYSSDGRRMLAGTYHRLIVEIDSETFEPVRSLSGHHARVDAIACSPSGERVASSSNDGTIRVWRDGSVEAALSVGHASPLAFSPDGSALVFNAGEEFRLWDFSAGPVVLEGHSSYVYYVGYSPDGSRLASGAYFASEAFVWNPTAAERITALDLAGPTTKTDWALVHNSLLALGFTPEGMLLAGTYLFDPGTGAPKRRAVPSIDLLHHGRLEADSLDAHARQWKRFGPATVWSDDGALLAYQPEVIQGKGAAPLAVVDREGTIHFELKDNRYWGAAFSPDTRLLAAAQDTGVVEVWNLRSQELVARLDGHVGHGAVYCVTFHPDGTRLASGGNDNTVRLWVTGTWEQVHEMRGHSSFVKALAFSPDGTQLASASGDRTVRLWDTVSRADRARQARATLVPARPEAEAVSAPARIVATPRSLVPFEHCFDLGDELDMHPVAGEWTITAEGELQGRGGDDIAIAMIWAGSPPGRLEGDFRVAFDVSFHSVTDDVFGRYGGVRFFTAAPTEHARDTGYNVAWIDGDKNSGFHMSRGSDQHDVRTHLLLGTPEIAAPPKRWEIEVEGDAIHLRGDGKHIKTVRDNVHRKGYLGFWVYRGRAIRIDNVVISSPAAKSHDPACAER